MTANNSPIRMGEPPDPGFRVLRLVPRGPWVGAQITFDEIDGYRVMRDGEWQGPSRDPWLLPFMHQVAFARVTTESDVKYRIGAKRWAEIYKPDAPEANAKKPIDLDKLIPY